MKTNKIENTLNRLIEKSEYKQGARMPSIKQIKELLEWYGIKTSRIETEKIYRTYGIGAYKEGYSFNFTSKNGHEINLNNCSQSYMNGAEYYAKLIIETINK